MKCSHCGSELSIEDATCPFCGHVNEGAKEYTQTMQHYEKEWKTAKKKVDHSTHFVKSTVVFLVVAVFLSIANIVLAYMNKNIYEIENYFQRKKIERHMDTYIDQMDAMIAAEDYATYRQFYYKNDIYLVPIMDSYHAFEEYSEAYSYIFQNLPYLIFDEIKGYMPNKEQNITTLARNVARFYELYAIDDDRYPKRILKEEHLAHVNDMNQNIRTLFSYYFSLSPEELDQISSMSETQLAILIGRRLGIYE